MTGREQLLAIVDLNRLDPANDIPAARHAAEGGKALADRRERELLVGMEVQHRSLFAAKDGVFRRVSVC